MSYPDYASTYDKADLHTSSDDTAWTGWETAETYSDGHDYKIGEGYGDITAWAGWETAETYSEDTYDDWTDWTSNEDQAKPIETAENFGGEMADGGDSKAKVNQKEGKTLEPEKAVSPEELKIIVAKRRVRGKQPDDQFLEPQPPKKKDNSKTKKATSTKDEAIHWVPLTQNGYVKFVTGEGTHHVAHCVVDKKMDTTAKTEHMVKWAPVTRAGAKQFVSNCGQATIKFQDYTLQQLIDMLKKTPATDLLDKSGGVPPYVRDSLLQIEDMWKTWGEDSVENVSYWLMEMCSPQFSVLYISTAFFTKQNLPPSSIIASCPGNCGTLKCNWRTRFGLKMSIRHLELFQFQNYSLCYSLHLKMNMS